MPRNGSDIYFIPPGTEGFPDRTIESEKYNSYIHDVETDLNTPRPIVAGGTGADNANEALANIGAEKSSQAVTNYDSHVFIPGSFYSATSATAAPVAGHTFVGWVVSSDAPADPPTNQNVVVHARDQSGVTAPGRLYVREKKAGVWGPWGIDGSGIAGDTPPLGPPDGALWWDNESGQLYVYYNDGNSKQWVIASPVPDPGQFLLKAGDTMIGTLGLAASPVAAMDAVNKQYVDGGVDGVTGGLSGKVAKTGDTMSGPLTLSANPTAPLHAATKQYVDERQGHGQCYFSLVDANTVKLTPLHGNVIKIDGVGYHMPVGGVSAVRTSCYINGVAAQTLAAGQLYSVYAFSNAGTVTLDFYPGLGHSTHSDGVEIKTGDASRTLVGMARTIGSGAFQDDSGFRGVASWFNRKQKSFAIFNTNTTGNATAITPWSYHAGILAWAGDLIDATYYETAANSLGGQFGGIAIWDNVVGGAVSGVAYTYVPPAYANSIAARGTYNAAADGLRQVAMAYMSGDASNAFYLMNNYVYGSVIG